MAIFGTAPAPTTATETVFTWGRQFLPDEFVTRIEGANEQPNPDPNDPGTPNRE